MNKFYVTYYCIWNNRSHITGGGTVFDTEKDAIYFAKTKWNSNSGPRFCLIESENEILGVPIFSEEDLLYPDGLEYH